MKDKPPLRLVASEPPPRPHVPALDLAPTGKLPHTVRTAGKAASR